MLKNFTLLILTFCCCPYVAGQTSFHGKAKLILNKTGHNSFAPVRYGDKLYFSSRFLDGDTGQPVTRLFAKRVHDWELQELEINPQKGGSHASNLSMSSDGKTIYYSLCQDETDRKCTIWMRTKEYDGRWGAAVKLPAHINLRGQTATQPSIGYDQTLNKKVLYFVSDRPNGKGGMDIYQSVIELDGSFGLVTPLPFNSSGDDISPFFQLSQQTLFFSSNGMGGEGGFDIWFSQKPENGRWNEPINLGTAVNGPYNESYFTYHTGHQKAYFTSDRPIGSVGKEGVGCIYETTPQIELSLWVFNLQSRVRLYGTSAHVYDEERGQKLIYNEQPFDPYLKVFLSPDRMYKVVVLREGFVPQVLEVSTLGMLFPTVLQENVYLSLQETSGHGHPVNNNQRENNRE